MKRTLAVYGIAYLVLLMIVFGLQYVYPKLELHLLLNSHHTGIQDTFFKYYSMMAEGPIYVLALLPLLWKKIKLTIFFALCELTGGGVLQILKHTFSSDRPVSAFEHYQDVALPLVQGVEMHHSNSFPSGHASTFFVFFTCLALFLAYYYHQKQPNRRTWILVHLSMLVLFVLAWRYGRTYCNTICPVGTLLSFLSRFSLLKVYFDTDKCKNCSLCTKNCKDQGR